MQLLPALISFLTPQNPAHAPSSNHPSTNTSPLHTPDLLSFASVVVYSCEAICWDESCDFLPEFVDVQPDPDYVTR
eukprot:m.423422 g.423422  ORF g.423422 m.423422 type:complete len:76 (-) comp56659_c0_seq90:123-350(-)